MAETMVSIILPTYNRIKLLGMAIESILKQTYPYFELIIVDDGSTDGTEGFVSGIRDDRIRYHKLEKNSGQSKARNYGIAQARHDYIAFEDSDDFWHVNKLAVQMEHLQKAAPEVGFCYHKARHNIDSRHYVIMPDEKIAAEKKSGDIYAQLLNDNLVDCPTILAKKECILQAGGFDETMKALEDYDLALKMAKHFHALFINQTLLEVTYSESGVSGSPTNYLIASCYLLQKYKADYLKTNTLNHRIEIILRDSEAIGMKEHFIRLLEISLTAN